MLLEVDLASSEPIYRQIRGQIVAAVANGDLQPGDSLPSVRVLAGELGVNMHTVNKAYAVLRDEGYVAMRGRSGAYVADAANGATRLQAQVHEERLSETLRRAAVEMRARGGSREDFLDLARAQADIVFPNER